MNPSLSAVNDKVLTAIIDERRLVRNVILTIIAGILIGLLIYTVFKISRSRRMSARRQLSDSLDMVSFRMENAVESMPRYFAYNKELLTGPVNQHKCGSCYIISVCNMLADRISLATRGSLVVHLSPQYLLCTDSGRTGAACDGGGPEEVLEYIEDNGVVLEEFMPYKQDDFQDKLNVAACVLADKRAVLPENKVYIEPGSVKFLCKSFFSLGSGAHLENIKRMKYEIIANGCIVGTVYVHDDMYDYRAGSVYKKSKHSKFLYGHSIEIVGFCDRGCGGGESQDARGNLFGHVMDMEPYWIVKNSWGDKFGTGGYMFVRMYTNEVEIASRASAGTPCMSAALYKKLFNRVPLAAANARIFDAIY
jgi:C1A family cysteine protease